MHDQIAGGRLGSQVDRAVVMHDGFERPRLQEHPATFDHLAHGSEPHAGELFPLKELDQRPLVDVWMTAEDDVLAFSQRDAKLDEKTLADGFITINDSIARWYRNNYPDAPEPTVVMNATARTHPFQYDGRLHRAVGLPPGARILLYQGGFARKRGLEQLVEAAAFMPAEWTLVMMGWGKLEPELRSMAARVNAQETATRNGPAVRFLAAVPQEELPYWSAGGTLGVIPHENVGLNHCFCTPNKLWEYPNAGVPVLVSPFPELRKPVEAFGFGWLLPDPVQPDLLAAQIAALTDEEIAVARQRCQAFSDVENWAKYEVPLIALYGSVLQPERRKAAELSSPAPVTIARTG